MASYIIQRILSAVFTLFCVSVLVYALCRTMPGNPALIDAEANPDRKMDAEDWKRIEAAYGLDRPWYVGYVVWLKNLVRGDLGQSIRFRTSVFSLIRDNIGATLLLATTSFAIIYAVSVPVGVLSAAYSAKLFERFVAILLYGFYSLPEFVAALFLLFFFYVKLKGTYFQLSPGMVSDNYQELSGIEKIGDVARHLILPVISYIYGSIAFDSRFVKANMEEVLRADFIRTARAKGAGPFRLLVWHGFRNTLIPFVTLLGLTLPSFVGGAIIIERIFAWPGMGTLFLNALTFRDYAIIMAVTMLLASLTLLGQLLADIAYVFVDPRVSYQ